ncbi:hypothetical protein SEPCBS119000_005978 [Sporothrix epigloea]|uniref:Microbial-type PARG catalytic domain-containing protein n=1 Tax=Sporothrix epigloea TaxID=1892477 RepID=A0ABP0E2D2_9PEZI
MSGPGRADDSRMRRAESRDRDTNQGRRASRRTSRSQSPPPRSRDPLRDRNMRLTAFFRPLHPRPAPASASAAESPAASRDSTLGDRPPERDRNRHRHADRDSGQRLGRASGRGEGRDRAGSWASGRRDHRRTRGRADGSPRTNNIVAPAAYPPGQRDRLREVAQETLYVLPKILHVLGASNRASAAHKYDPWSLPALDAGQCPRFARPATIRVLDSDTINAALDLRRFTHADLGSGAKTAAGTPLRPPLIVNFASHKRPGGGWLNGALAQEEALCYRSSLAQSLDRRHYPLDREDVLYSPYVLILRSDQPSGHQLLVPSTHPQDLPIVSAVSVAALQRPALRTVAIDENGNVMAGTGASNSLTLSETREWQSTQDTQAGVSSRRSSASSSFVSWSQSDHAGAANRQAEHTLQPTSPGRVSRTLSPQHSSACPSVGSGSPTLHRTPARERAVFAYQTDRFCTMLKMRLVLRAAARAGHHQLVLGALGCGVFGNPPEEVARCWLEVLQSPEFTAGGHWWQDVVFAVYDGQSSQNGQLDLGTRRDGGYASNYRIFYEILDGQQA